MGKLTGSLVVRRRRRGRWPGEPPVQQRHRSSARTTGTGAPSRATGGSSTSTSRPSRRRAACSWSTPTWDDAAPFTDLDTLIFGPSENHYQLLDDGAVRCPVHPRHGREEPEPQHRGRRLGLRYRDGRRTRTSWPRPAQEGLHAIVEHQVQLERRPPSTCRSRRPSAAPRSTRPSVDVTDAGRHRRVRRDVRGRASTWPAWRPRRSASASRR